MGFIDPNKTFTFEGVTVAVKGTDKALLVKLSDGKQVFVPQSQIHDDSEVYKEGHSGKLVVTGWWAVQKGFIKEEDLPDDD